MSHAELRRDVALANRIVHAAGLVNAFGHVSGRIAGTDTFLFPTRASPAPPPPEAILCRPVALLLVAKAIVPFGAQVAPRNWPSRRTSVTAGPPVLPPGKPLAGTGIDASLLGTSARMDGQLEVVYNGHPLYYFIADKKAGDTTGQGINNFGGPWYVVGPSGNKIDKG